MQGSLEIVLPILETDSAFEAAAITNKNASPPPALNTEAFSPPPVDNSPLKAPPSYELKQLIEMVHQGRILEIQHKTKQLAQRNKDYIPFANNLRRLAKEFKEKQILDLLQSCIQD